MNVIYAQQDGSLAVITPAAGTPIEEVAKKDVPAGAAFKIVEAVNVDSEFFTAYDFSGGKIVFNIERGRELWRDKWREARKPLLAALDLEFMRAIEEGTTKEQEDIALKKRALRSVTNFKISGKTPMTIRQTWPEILGARPE